MKGAKVYTNLYLSFRRLQLALDHGRHARDSQIWQTVIGTDLS